MTEALKLMRERYIYKRERIHTYTPLYEFDFVRKFHMIILFLSPETETTLWETVYLHHPLSF